MDGFLRARTFAKGKKLTYKGSGSGRSHEGGPVRCILRVCRLCFFFFLAAVDGDGEAIYVPVVAMMTERRTTHRNATQRNASIGIGRHRAGHRSWHTAFGRLLSRTLLFYILGSTHRPPPASEQKK